jgi:membrane protein required for colicin V production
MNFLDLGILIILALMAVRGFFKGIIEETAALFGLLISFFLASLYYKSLAIKLSSVIPNYPFLLPIFCFILFFVLSFFLIRILAKAARGAIRLAFLGWLDRTLGALFGLFKGIVILMVLISLLLLLSPKASSIVRESRLYHPLQILTEKMIRLIPPSIKEDFTAYQKNWQDFWTGKKENLKKIQKGRRDE